jgi:hypothetical protein
MLDLGLHAGGTIGRERLDEGIESATGVERVEGLRNRGVSLEAFE